MCVSEFHKYTVQFARPIIWQKGHQSLQTEGDKHDDSRQESRFPQSHTEELTQSEPMKSTCAEQAVLVVQGIDSSTVANQGRRLKGLLVLQLHHTQFSF